jgi:fatty-acyl-CoA synthase
MANFWRIVEKNGINYFSAVPTILSDLLTRSINADVSSLRFAICGAAPLSVELFTRFEKATGLKILEGYGLTESSCGASVNPYHGERRIGSVGMRLPYEDMLCVQLDNQGHFQCDCAPGEVGIVALRGPHIFSGYSDSTHEQELWIDRGEGARWLNTGDLGRIDEDGYLWLVGRRKDLIIRGGHNIDPKMIEEALYRHDAVQHAVAIGRPDARLGEVPVAYVTLQPGATVTGEELKVSAAAFISDRVAIPRDVIVVPEMPLTPVGKISKVALVEREIRTIVANISRRLSCNLTHLETETTSGGQIVRVEGASDELIRELKAFPFTVEQVRSSAA